ncbi:SLOB protein kinase [Saprolegnia diclina VS20]|uniref:SLOB protein kinase n=1 Tax=Saprolegnia diclina (strain VS20) TaxID=1156394 RepID=T0QDK4_SAPDV|nr:SLOB protein kinase [Saprolegnia diclina VS20]EQC32831.1 SLOB protein kinase [Saprolegnia diclina VS20]|eukprot:XP_008613517.1 SLOB protein kinase [Saprolegnia diclina VS20]
MTMLEASGHPWLHLLAGVAVGLAACLAAYGLYELYRRCTRRPKPINRYESSHLLARADMDWPVLMPDVAQSYLSPIPEERHNEDLDETESAYGIATREKAFCKEYCETSTAFDWLDKPALYMGRNRAKRLYLLGQASSGGNSFHHRSYMSSFRKQYLLSMYPSLPTDAATLSLLQALMAQIALCPQVVPVLDVAYLDHETPRMAAISPWMNQGSLKDYIVHRSQTMLLSMPYHKKFKRYGVGRPLASSAIARMGRDILLGMQQLQSLGIPSYHLHTGNILMEYEQVRVGGYEALLFQAGRLQSPISDSDDKTLPLTLFGHVLFEMAFGVELSRNRLDDDGQPIYANLHRPSDRVQDVLDAIFQDQRHGLSIESLLQMPLFLPRAQRPSKLQRRMLAKASEPPSPVLTEEMKTYVEACVSAFHGSQMPVTASASSYSDCSTFA